MVKQALTISLLIFLGFVLLSGCGEWGAVERQEIAPTTPPVQTPEILPTMKPTPSYILNIHPTGTITLEEYNQLRTSNMWLARGIGVSIWINRMEEVDKERDWSEIKEKIILVVDGDKISDETLKGGADGEKGGSLFRISWTPELDPGLHTAKFQYVNDAGEVIEYEWQFSFSK